MVVLWQVLSAGHVTCRTGLQAYADESFNARFHRRCWCDSISRCKPHSVRLCLPVETNHSHICKNGKNIVNSPMWPLSRCSAEWSGCIRIVG